MSRCTNCGRENQPGRISCLYCGAALPSSPPNAPDDWIHVPEPKSRRPGETPAPEPRVHGSDEPQPARPAASLRLLDPEPRVDPGGDVTIGVQIRNSGNLVDEFVLTVEGVPAPWARVEPARIQLMPGTEAAARVTFRPPRQPQGPVGPVAFQVRARSREETTAGVEPGILTVGEFRDVAAALAPQTNRSSGLARYGLAIENRGNVPTDAHVRASDPDLLLDIVVAPVRVQIPPGDSAEVRIQIRPRRTTVFGKPDLRSFRVEVEPDIGPPLIVAGSFVQLPRIPAWLPAAAGGLAATLLAVVVVFGGGRPGLTPNPTATAPPSITAAPTASITAAPTASATISPSPTASPSISPSPTATATITAAPTATAKVVQASSKSLLANQALDLETGVIITAVAVPQGGEQDVWYHDALLEPVNFAQIARFESDEATVADCQRATMGTAAQPLKNLPSFAGSVTDYFCVKTLPGHFSLVNVRRSRNVLGGGGVVTTIQYETWSVP